MNFIIFNHDGSIKNVNFAEIIVQGNNLVDEIFVAVEGRSTDSYLATAYFELPNGESNFLTATLASRSIDQSAYNGYKFLLTGAQTALYGRVRMSLKLEGMQGETLWTYEQVLTINKSGYNPDFTMITMSQYAALVQAMGSLQEKFVVNNARFYSSLANAQADLDNLAFNQCVIIADVTATDPIPQIYFKNSESQLELLAGIGEYTFQAGTTTTQTLSPGSDATVSVSFVASGKTITMNFTFGIPRGNTGATGNGIASIEKYSTEGQVDTYRITYTNGSHFDFDVTNGTLAGHLLSSTFEYDDERPLDSLSMQLAEEIRRLVDADGSKVKSIMASKPTSEGGVQTYSIIWDYNVNIIPGALNIQDGDFYFENEGVLTSIDSHLEDYTFSIFHEIEGTSVEDFGYIEIVDTAKVGSGTLTQAELTELRKPISFIRYQTGVRSYDMLISYYSARQANHTISKYFRGFMHKGSEDFDSAYAYNLSRSFITVTNLNSTTTGGWSYTLNVDAYVDKTPTQNSTNLVTSGGVHSAIATASAALDAKITALQEIVYEISVDVLSYTTEYADLFAIPSTISSQGVIYSAGAEVNSIKFRSVVANQLALGIIQTTTTNGITFTNNGDGSITISGTAEAQVEERIFQFDCVSGNSYLIVGGDDSSQYGSSIWSYTNSQTIKSASIITASATQSNMLFLWRIAQGTQINKTIWPMAINLTEQNYFNIPASIDDSRVKQLLSEYHEYNSGSLVDCEVTAIRVRGYNLFDGELQFGGYSDSGSWIGAQNIISNKNPIIVKGGVQYTFSQHNFTDAAQKKIVQLDASGNFITSTYASSGTANQTITTAQNAHTVYLQFAKSSAYSSLPTDPQICFHLASADLGYKPYVAPVDYPLPSGITQRGVGTAHDTLEPGKHTRAVGKKTVGDVDWSYDENYHCFYSNISDRAQDALVIVVGYQRDYNLTSDKTYSWSTSSNRIWIRDDSYQGDASAFKAGKATTAFVYNLATHIETPVDFDPNLDLEEGGSIELVNGNASWGCLPATDFAFATKKTN